MRAILVFFSLCIAASAFAGPKEVPRGSDLRNYLFELARAPVAKVAGRPVKFAGPLKQMDGWAFFNGTIVDESGNKILIGEAESADTVVLWKLSNGEWDLVAFATGITDVAWEPWPRKYGAPMALLFPEG